MALVSNGSFNNGIKTGKNYNYSGQIEIEKEVIFRETDVTGDCHVKQNTSAPLPKKKQYHKLSFVDPKFYKDTHNHIYKHSMKVDIKRDREVREQTEGGNKEGRWYGENVLKMHVIIA